MGWNWVAQATKRRGVGPLALVLALAVGGLAGMAPAQAAIANTKHNLTASGTGTNKFDGTQEICVFCHTPHGSDTSAAVPLWNRKLAAPTSYTTYDQLKTSTLDGTVMQVGSVSLACLSCHDGQTAMSAVINAPGSGGYNAAGANMPGAWTGTNVNTTTGQLTGNGVSMLGQDLRNDHPIGIQYGGGGITSAGGTTKDPDFKTTANATLNGTKVWWVDTTGGTANRDKTDMILYTRQIVAGTDEPFVECASCHDPHSENTTFLRIANTGSAVCLACHTK